jgi:hypothetical protein
MIHRISRLCRLFGGLERVGNCMHDVLRTWPVVPNSRAGLTRGAGLVLYLTVPANSLPCWGVGDTASLAAVLESARRSLRDSIPDAQGTQ